MRIIAIILNFVLIGVLIFLVIAEPHMNIEEIIMTVLFLIVPISNLAAFYLDDTENWISLFLKRKAMEEKAKISKLNDNDT